MGPPGGGRNDISSRFIRHLNVVGVDEFDDATMTRIFTSISDWHFAKGFESTFNRLSKVNNRCFDLSLLLFILKTGTIEAEVQVKSI